MPLRIRTVLPEPRSHAAGDAGESTGHPTLIELQSKSKFDEIQFKVWEDLADINSWVKSLHSVIQTCSYHHHIQTLPTQSKIARQQLWEVV